MMMTTADRDKLLESQQSRKSTKNAFQKAMQRSKKGTPLNKKKSPRGGFCGCFKASTIESSQVLRPEQRKKERK